MAPGMPAEGSTSQPAGFVRLVFPAAPLAVRDALQQLFGALPGDLVAGDRITAELVISEVLNNIVEHAYGEQGGEIELSTWPVAGGLQCAVTDQGTAMPDARLPQGRLPNPAAADLPEGGFGWHLIHSLARDIRYLRLGEINLLTFHLPSEQSPESD